MREMVGGCCVCSDERGWAENPLVYCDGHGCSVAVHQACYGIVQVPTGPWFCRKCESQERAARVRCELCPHKDGALKRTDSGGWAHVVCALYIPEVQFANVLTMEPIILQYVPHERYIKTCYICEDHGRESKAACGACMTCNRQGCRQAFHVTCAQMAGLLCEEEGPEADNVKYCGYCKHHYNKMVKKTQKHDESILMQCFTYLLDHLSNSLSTVCIFIYRASSIMKRWFFLPSNVTVGHVGFGFLPAQISSSHHGSSKDGEGKSKKLSSHSHGHRSKKPGSTGKSCSSSSCSSSPFNPGMKGEAPSLILTCLTNQPIIVADIWYFVPIFILASSLSVV
uniref:MLLT10 histone lysine methyltransferase DOT1L cofactor n=1 Tax=Stegastes partitus TaxID=144197 RepID=A0A3B4Z2R7_9TELE